MRNIIVALTLVVALAACNKSESRIGALNGGGGGGIAAVSDASSPEAGRVASLGYVNRGAGTTSTAAPAALASNPAAAPAQRMPRMIIRTATITMVVGDTLQIVDRISAAVEANGGYVNDSKIWRDGEQTRATLSVRVPAPQLTQTLAAVRKLAVRVQSENVSSEEVTQEYVDLAAQLRNDEAAEVELRQLMTEIRQRAKKADDVLQIHEQLRTIRASIEKTKGRMVFLSQMSSYSTINLELIPDAIAKPVVEPGWQPVVAVRDASRALVSMLQSLATSAIWFVIYILPALLLLGLGLAILWRVLLVLKRRTSGITL
jgi:hypothetical protein